MLNTLSTTFTFLGYSLLTALSLCAVIIWILMLLDAVKRNKLLWFAIMLIAPVIGSLFYFLAERPKTLLVRKRQWLWVALAIFGLATLITIVPMTMIGRSSPTLPALIEFSGTVVEMDLSAMPGDGPGIYKVKDGADSVVTVRLEAGESACDRQAIRVPQAKIGDTVLISGKPDTANIIRVCEAGTYIKEQWSEPATTTSLNPTPLPVQDPFFTNDCESLVKYSAQAYQDGWTKIFKNENSLSDSEFNTYITVTSVSMRPEGRTCELNISYTIKKDWLLVGRVDDTTLGIPPTMSPDHLLLERDSTTPGRFGVSTINLRDPLAFKSESAALNYFVKTYDLQGTNAKVRKHDFQFFYNKEGAETSGDPFAGEGGEAFISIVGTINQSQNKCYYGELSMVGKEMSYREDVCWMN